MLRSWLISFGPPEPIVLGYLLFDGLAQRTDHVIGGEIRLTFLM